MGAKSTHNFGTIYLLSAPFSVRNWDNLLLSAPAIQKF